eukprot:Pgem_evm1s14699
MFLRQRSTRIEHVPRNALSSVPYQDSCLEHTATNEFKWVRGGSLEAYMVCNRCRLGHILNNGKCGT